MGNFQRANGFSPQRLDSSNYMNILASGAPLLDVRAPIEFLKGSFPNARNIPLLNDQHRQLVGTCYKEEGQEAAIALGHTLVTSTGLKSELVQSWKDHIKRNPNGYLYCFRGGLRSHIVQQWLKDAGINYPLILGGYKAMRSSLLLDLEISLKSLPIVLIGGRTCSGKTIALRRLTRFVDLEGLANHRGSSFGGIALKDQPAQIDFENSVILDLYKHRSSSSTLPVFLEDEGHRIGDLNLPIAMQRFMAKDFPLVILETPLQERVDLCIQEYILHPFLAYNRSGNKREAHASIRNEFLNAMGRIQKRLRKRLGPQQNLCKDFDNAFDLFESDTLNLSAFRRPIQSLLEDYYDPMYDYQIDKRKGEILFRGNMEELVIWAEDYRTTKQ